MGGGIRDGGGGRRVGRRGRPECRVGTHAHNDTALAVANSLAGVKGGARMVQGCVNGYGERTGKRRFARRAGNLELKMDRRCLPEGSVSRLVAVAGAVAKAWQANARSAAGVRRVERVRAQGRAPRRGVVEDAAVV